MTSPRALAIAAFLAAGLVLVIAVWVNLSVLAEAYGSGPPYYGRTTNMDKWEDRRPALIAGDVFVLGGCALLLRRGFRWLRRGR
jgi:hypothetical protein